MKCSPSGAYHTCAQTTSGGVKCWGGNWYGQLGDGTNINRTTPVDVVGLGSGVRAISAGGDHTCALAVDGGVKCWGDNDVGQLGDPTTASRLTSVNVVGLDSGVQSIATRLDHTCALTLGSGVRCWGLNNRGQLGDGTTTLHPTPVDVSGLGGGVQAIAAGYHYTCALTTSGGVKCWGSNHYGQLGDGTTTNRLTPVDVVGLDSGVQAIAVGASQTCALTAAGGVKCWGANYSGQLGDGTNISRTTPVDVFGLSSSVRAIGAGARHTCALTLDGGVRCWGDNWYGQLGDGTTTNRLTPIDVVGLDSGVLTIAAGNGHTCVLTLGGSVKCWGRNGEGQLGDGMPAPPRTSPVDVVGLGSDVQAIAAGELHTCALVVDGSIKCWGWNRRGQLGDGTNADHYTPVAVVELGSDVQAIAAGWEHTCALAVGGGVKCWRANYHGQLGDGTTTWRSTPVDVVAGTLAAIEVTGFVVDTSNRPIPGVFVDQVDPFGRSSSSYTDAAGVFTITANASGVHTVSVAKSMYTFSPSTMQVVMPPNQSGPVFIGALNPIFAPVVFIPGIMGSHLREVGTDTDLWLGGVWGTEHERLSNRPGERNAIFARDVIRRAVIDAFGWQVREKIVYEPLLQELTKSRMEYDVADDPARRTESGCDISQAANDPTLFVFAYDWRLSNDVNAERLKDYIACIHRFYPNAEIDIVAHSMGGLIARSYILKATPNHFVRRLITVGTPWLGAPKFLHAIEKGDLEDMNWLVSHDEVRRLIEAFPGAHELLPSATYFEYARRSGEPDVFIENGWDINGDGNSQQTYSYNDLVGFVNARYPREGDCGNPTNSVCRVGDNNRTFHSLTGQDRWTSGPQDIEYRYIVGIRRSRDTIAGLVAKPVLVCTDIGCFYVDRIVSEDARGDGTVPLVSARRSPLDQTPDGSNITIEIVNPSNEQDDEDDSNTEHLGMLHNPNVLAKITQILDSAPGVQAVALDETIPPAEPAYYLNVLGANVGYVTNSDGKVTGIVSPTLTLREAGEVTFLPFSTQNFQAIIPTYDVYTVTFQSGDLPMLIDLVREGDEPPDYAARWRDLVMPPNTVMQLILSPEGVRELRYDASGDGTPDTPVSTPPVIAEGPAAADTTPPTVTVTVATNQVITIAAEDETGVAGVYYSFDETFFQAYTGPVSAPYTATAVYAFADDTLANRSSVTTVPLTPDTTPPNAQILYLPAIQR